MWPESPFNYKGPANSPAHAEHVHHRPDLARDGLRSARRPRLWRGWTRLDEGRVGRFANPNKILSLRAEGRRRPVGRLVINECQGRMPGGSGRFFFFFLSRQIEAVAGLGSFLLDRAARGRATSPRPNRYLKWALDTGQARHQDEKTHDRARPRARPIGGGKAGGGPRGRVLASCFDGERYASRCCKHVPSGTATKAQ